MDNFTTSNTTVYKFSLVLVFHSRTKHSFIFDVYIYDFFSNMVIFLNIIF